MPAPQAMQFWQMPGLMKTATPGDQMKDLAKNIGTASKTMFPQQPPAQFTAPGAGVGGGAGPISAGGAMGPAPLPGQQALPGSPYSAAAGPPAPPPPGSAPGTGGTLQGSWAGPPGSGVPMPQPRPMVANQPQGGAMVGGQPGTPPPGAGASPVANMAQNPMMLQALLQQIAQRGGAPGVPGIPGSAATTGAGMLAPLMNQNAVGVQ